MLHIAAYLATESPPCLSKYCVCSSVGVPIVERLMFVAALISVMFYQAGRCERLARQREKEREREKGEEKREREGREREVLHLGEEK